MSQLISKYDYPEFLQPIGLSSPTVDNQVIDLLMFGAGPTQQNINVDQVTETETALAITAQKRISVAQVSETDVAQVLTKGRSVSVPQVTETDSVFSIAKSKTKTITQVVESDLSQAIGKQKRKPLRIATTPNKVPTASSYFDDDSGIVFWEVTTTVRVWNSGGWMDLSHPSGGLYMFYSVTVIPWQDGRKTYRLSFKAKSDSYTGQIKIWMGSNSFVIPTNVNSNWQELNLEFEYISGSEVFRVELASSASAGAIVSFDDIEIFTLTDFAQTITRVKRLSIGQVIETDSVQSIGKAKLKSVTQATETDSVQPIGKKKFVTVNPVIETETALEITVVVRDNKLPQVSETDTALPIQAVKKINVIAAEENNFSIQLARVIKQANISFAEEVDEAIDISRKVTTIINVEPVYEINEAGKIIYRNFDINLVEAKDINSLLSDDGIFGTVKDYGLATVVSDGFEYASNIKDDDLASVVSNNIESRIIE